MRIEDEIKQKSFKNEFLKASVNILFTSSWLTTYHAILLKPYKLTVQQFNILRILKGQGENAVTVRLLAERMIDKMSNASRLVDKLVNKKLVERTPCKSDRRQVDIVITKEGLKIVDQVSDVFEKDELLAKNLTKEEAIQLNDLLDKFRG